MHEIGDADAESIQRDHGGGEDAHVQDVGGRGYNRRHDEDDQNGIAKVPPHPSGSHNAHEGQKKYQDWHFENQPHAQDNAQEKFGVFLDGDHGLELLAETDQKIQGRRIDDFEAEITARGEERDGRYHEGHDITLFITVESWGDEHPDLIEDERRG